MATERAEVFMCQSEIAVIMARDAYKSCSLSVSRNGQVEKYESRSFGQYENSDENSDTQQGH